jgi:hypothetical protein
MADATAVPPPPTGENSAGELIRSLGVVAGFALFFMTLRFFCKARYAKGFGIDDGVLAMAFVSSPVLQI